MNTPSNTLAAIGESVKYHERRAALARFAQQTLSIPFKEIVYEVHIQSHHPQCRSIMAEGSDLLDVCRRAVRLNRDYNNGRARADLELFVRCGDVIVAILPEDAVGLLPEDCRTEFSFHLDGRLAGVSSNLLVFKIGEDLPSAHYAKTPTSEPEPAGV